MTKQRSGDTREKLLTAASDVFVEKGFRDATVAEICKPAEARLRGQVKALIRRISDENNKDFFISQMEFVNPTGLLEEVMKSELIPLREKTLSVVRELLGQEATEEQVVFCETCILSMCVHPMLMQRASLKMKNAEMPVMMYDLDAYIEHVMKFALAGIAAIKSDFDLVGLAAQHAGAHKTEN
jgi:AcrR family transcriptional regulator